MNRILGMDDSKIIIIFSSWPSRISIRTEIMNAFRSAINFDADYYISYHEV